MRNKEHGLLLLNLFTFPKFPDFMGLYQPPGSHLFFRLHSPGILSVRMPQVIRDPEHCFNLFDAFLHSTISTGTWARVLSAL